MTFSSKTSKNSPKTVAYLRVSTIDQDVDKNKAAILALANSRMLGHVQFIEEKVSGKVAWRNRKIAGILDDAKAGDNTTRGLSYFWTTHQSQTLKRSRYAALSI